jgi:two-component system, LuxR family, response regulator FixJ
VSEPAPLLYVVDDDSSFLASLSRLLSAAGYSVRRFGTAEEFLAQPSDTPGCVIADLRMPGLSGLDLQAALTQAGSLLPVVFLTGEGDIPTSVQAMRLGAEDFLTKRASKETLFETIERALTRNATQRAERTRLLDLRARFDALSDREREVLQHVVRGRLNKQIAADLGIHERTVKLHRTAITTKLNVHSVAELALLVRDAGMLD